MIRENLVTKYFTEDDLGYSIYKTGEEYEVWIKVGAGTLKLRLDQVFHVEAMIQNIIEDLGILLEEDDER